MRPSFRPRSVRYVGGIGMAGLVLAAAVPVAAAVPTVGLSPLTATSLVLPPGASATIRYQVTNRTNRAHTLTMVPIPGIAQVQGADTCPSPFVLGARQSCILALDVQASHVPGAGIRGGPVICETKGAADPGPNLLRCSQPSVQDALVITIGCQGCSSPDGGDPDAGAADASASGTGDASADAHVEDASASDASTAPEAAVSADASATELDEPSNDAAAGDPSRAPASEPPPAAVSDGTFGAAGGSSCAATPGADRKATSVAGALAAIVAIFVVRRRRRRR